MKHILIFFSLLFLSATFLFADEVSVADDALESTTKKEFDNALVLPGFRSVWTVKGVEFAFRWCPAGTFMMGSPTDEEGRYDDETRHQVTLTKGFWMLETEVTQKQWKAVMGTNPSVFKGDDLPVERVSRNDCQEFCRKCTKLGLPVQLPTEAQWEYACRAGTTGAFAGNLEEMAWYKSNSDDKTHPVGTKKPNAWGLYDMYGNVWEWCQDWFEDYPSGSVTDPTGPSNGSMCVDRGGCLSSPVRNCRSALRDGGGPDDVISNKGFRVVQTEKLVKENMKLVKENKNDSLNKIDSGFSETTHNLRQEILRLSRPNSEPSEDNN